MEKKTATEQLLKQEFFAQVQSKDTDTPEEEVGKPKSRSTRSFLESLKSDHLWVPGK